MADTKDEAAGEVEEVVEGNDENENDGDPTQVTAHPLDILNDCIENIETQFKRLKNNRCGDLRYELKHNIYPIIKNGFTAIIDYLDALEEEDEEGEDVDEPPPEVQEAIQKSFEEVKNLCNNILLLDTKLAGATMPDPYPKILAWAKDSKPKFDEAEKEANESAKVDTKVDASVEATATVNATATVEATKTVKKE